MTRPRLAWPFTIIPRGDEVWLVAGEDIRFTLRAERAASWLPALLERCDGAHELDALVASVPADARDAARELLADLAGERVLVEGAAADIPQPASLPFAVEGHGRLADALRTRAGADATAIRVLAQDDLDLTAALAAATRWRAESARGLWVTIGPVARAYIGPLLLPDAGPCLECLLGHFRLLSPVPEVYDVLLAHRGSFAPAAFPDEGVAAAAALAAWKLARVGREPASPAVYALHVVDAATLEVSSHRVFRDPECPTCAGT